MFSSASCRRFLLLACSYGGTMDCLKFIEQRIRHDDLTYLELALIVPTCLHYARPNEHTVDVAIVSIR